MYILGNNVTSQEEFDAHVIAEKEEHKKVEDLISTVSKDLSHEIDVLRSKQARLEKQTFRLYMVMLLVALAYLATSIMTTVLS